MRPPFPNAFWNRRLVVLALTLLGIAGLAWATLAPIRAGSREQLFEIPPGTSARRMAGEDLAILPRTIRLTVGVNDVLVLRNADDVPHVFGPALMLPGQSFRLPFRTASTYSFLCTAHAEGQLNVIVEPAPAAGWERLRWRWARLTDAA